MSRALEVISDAVSTTTAAANGSVVANATLAMLNGTAAAGELVAEEADDVLRVTTRIIALVTILIIIGLIALVLNMPPTKEAISNKLGGMKDNLKIGCVRFRYWKRCCLNLCCCCAPKLKQTMGYESLYRAGTSLSITFLHARSLKLKKQLYFEAWTEPEEAPRKSCNPFMGAEDVDLSAETVELHWFSDEDCLKFGVLEYTGLQVQGHKPLGEATLSLKAVSEAIVAAQTGTMNVGAVPILIYRHDEVDFKKKAAARKVNPSNPLPLVLKQGIHAMQQTAYEKFGEEYPDLDEMEALRNENKKLRDKLGGAATEIPPTQTKKAPEPELICELWVRIEVVQKKKVDSTAFKSTVMQP
eukprot:TRINITY_DN76178_c0_g1_i1.p1 TRINITY_DN76178_c0_g1~~TRINITY_DN76178_c0_g1_i1.p1  ORF type:complete len:357 (-),score=101.87 TRINITY_DN76178_c0_g1_i1:282-1352(-)